MASIISECWNSNSGQSTGQEMRHSQGSEKLRQIEKDICSSRSKEASSLDETSVVPHIHSFWADRNNPSIISPSKWARIVFSFHQPSLQLVPMATWQCWSDCVWSVSVLCKRRRVSTRQKFDKNKRCCYLTILFVLITNTFFRRKPLHLDLQAWRSFALQNVGHVPW